MESLELTPSGGSIRLEEDGIVYGPRDERGSYTCYRDVTHMGVGRFGFTLGTRDGIVLLRRGRFDAPDGPERLYRALAERIAAQPGGLAQLARFVELDKQERHPPRRWATNAVILICLVMGYLQVSDRFVTDAAAMFPGLVEQGEWWRLFTANFLHAMTRIPLHLIFNLSAIFVLALFVERPLGSLRTFVVMVVAGAAAMAMGLVADYDSIVGASGIASGLAGAALALELRSPERLPVSWRLPRRLLVTVILLDGAIGFIVPFVAGWSHFGGFAAGYLATRVFEAQRAGAAARPLRVAAAACALALLASFLSAGRLIARDGSALSRFATHLLETEVAAGRYNDVAWIMATESNATQQELEPAVRLAEKAVEATGRENPDLLDTLAEVLFQIGELDEAVYVIDEAIEITHGEEPYFREQRKRFTGERDADDRPDPPAIGWFQRRRELPIAPRNPQVEI